MKPPNGNRIEEIYHAALALPASERTAFVENACASDADLFRNVISLLQAYDSSSGFLDEPVWNLHSEPDNPVGTTIDRRYEVEKELGHGGMSQVYFARDLNLQRQPVVIKVLSQALVDEPYARQKFDQEVEALLRIRHSGVVRVQDAGKLVDGRPYIVMEYVDGEPLRPLIRSEGMDLRRAASILKQIGEALKHVHEKGIFHRDLKPENIMLRRGTDSVVLIDFGIAKVKDSAIAESTVEGESAGTVLYMSPEQLRGAEVTAASDVYSMAIITYEMVTGRRPFRPNSGPELLKLQEAGVRVKPRQLREDLSTNAQTILLTALSFEPMARYQSAREFGDKLAQALLDSPVPPSPKQRWKVVTTSLLVLAGVALLSYGIYKYTSGSINGRPPHTFTYWLTVQRMRDGEDYEEPFKANDTGIFESGDKFRLNVSSPDPGYVYVINEGPSEPDTNFKLAYPRKSTNNGSATLGANQSIELEWIVFRGPPGAENFWIVWSVAPVSELESAKMEAFNHPSGGLTSQTLVTVREYLKAKQSEIKVEPRRYKENPRTVVKGKGEILVMLVQINHK
jgi:serine/threonine-protein kinase